MYCTSDLLILFLQNNLDQVTTMSNC